MPPLLGHCLSSSHCTRPLLPACPPALVLPRIDGGRCRSRSSSPHALTCRAVNQTIYLNQDALNAAQEKGHPIPIVKIDNRTDNFATIVSIEFGNQLGELLDTILALKNLGLNIRRAKIRPGDAQKDPLKRLNKFYITDAKTAEKVIKSKRLEEIRMTILQNLLHYHPDAAEDLGIGPKAKRPTSRDYLHPLGPKARAEVKTIIMVEQDPEGAYTQIIVKTSDRPGLLTDIVHDLKDINVNVLSAEVDTEGPMAIDHFYVTYHGEPLPESMVLLVTNTLQYHLALAEVGSEESY